jgi:hypothetical protein
MNHALAGLRPRPYRRFRGLTKQMLIFANHDGCQPRTEMKSDVRSRCSDDFQTVGCLKNVRGGESSTTTDACFGTREELLRHENQEAVGWRGHCWWAGCSRGKRGRRSGRGSTRSGTWSHSRLGRTAASGTRMGAPRRPRVGSTRWRSWLGRWPGVGRSGSLGTSRLGWWLAAAGWNLPRRPLRIGVAQQDDDPSH